MEFDKLQKAAHDGVEQLKNIENQIKNNLNATLDKANEQVLHAGELIVFLYLLKWMFFVALIS